MISWGSFNKIISQPFAPAMAILGVSYLVINIGVSIWSSTLSNYVVEQLKMGPDTIGLLRSLANVPGLLAICFGYVYQKIRMFYLFLFAFMVLGMGLIVQGWSSSHLGVFLSAGMVSGGAILFYPLINSLCLQSNSAESAGRALGRLKGFGPLAAIFVAMLIIFLLPSLTYSVFFILIGGIVIVSGCFATLAVSKQFRKTKSFGRLKLAPHLWNYYLLNFLNGCKSALFKSFVIVLMVQDYHLEINATAKIALVGYLLSFCSYRIIGFFVSRFGHINVLRANYFCVAIIFFGYCISDSKGMLVILFLLDSLLVGTSVATDFFLKTQVKAKELVGHISTGITSFYLAGIIIPMAGGLLWKYIGYKIVFISGSMLMILAFIISSTLKTKNEEILVEKLETCI